MYKEVINQTSITAVLDKRYSKKTVLFPVKIQVYHQGKQKYYNTGQELSVEDWERLALTRVSNLVKVRNVIKERFDLVVRCVMELSMNGNFSFTNLECRLGRISAGSLIDGFKAKIEKLRVEKRVGTMLYYQNTQKNIEKYAGVKIPYEDVTVQWLKNYEKWMLSEGLSASSIGMHMRAVRAIMNTALKDERIHPAQYPFGKDKYEIRKAVTIKRALSMSQIAAIANYDEGTLATDHYRDLWLFIYLCNGINVADLVDLQFKNIVDDEICFYRNKTMLTSSEIKEIRVILTPEMKRIIKRWGNDPSPDNYIFPLVKNHKDPEILHKEIADITRRLNRRMNEIGKALGIGRITTYTARHSFATALKRSGVNIAYISESLGHANVSTTNAYLSSFEKEERIKNARFLTEYLNK